MRVNDGGLTRKLAAWAVTQGQEPAPDHVARHVRRMVLDHLGGVVASSVGEVSTSVAEHVRRMYGPGEATAIGHGRTTVLGAALVNGTNGHGVEADDGYTPGSFHPTSVILPAVFGVGQAGGRGADEVIRAAAIGMELGCRIAAAGHPATRRNHFHNTPIAGVFGAAAATGVLMGLDEEEMANALGIAGSHSSGTFEFLGTAAEVKRFHPGKAARDGICSADLAKAGLTGPTTILEGPDGYFATYAGAEGTSWSRERLLDGLGERWLVEDTYIKPYPCCRHLHGAIDGVLALREQHDLDWQDVESIDVGTFAIAAGHDSTDVSTVIGAQLSMPYTLAVALRSGQVSLTDFASESRQDPAWADLMGRITLHVDEAADRDYPRSGRPASVTIRLADGQALTHHVQHPYGEKANAMSDEDLEGKVRRLVEPVIGPDGAKHLIEAAWGFDDLAFLDEVDALIRERGVARP
jgi:2-methylcitrate dehydratase PrpD